MLCREIIAVCAEIHTKHINTLCGQNVALLNVKHGGTQSNHWAVEGLLLFPSATQTRQQLFCSYKPPTRDNFI
jgi:hypothetical protein